MVGPKRRFAHGASPTRGHHGQGRFDGDRVRVDEEIDEEPVVFQMKSPRFREIAVEVMTFLTNADLAGFNLERFDLPLLAREFSDNGFLGTAECDKYQSYGFIFAAAAGAGNACHT